MLFQTIADLKQQSGNSFPNNSARVLGYYNPGDGGGGEFLWDDNAVEADDGGTIFEATSVTGRWKRVYNGAIFLDWFGADHRGNTDASVQFVSAIAAIKSIGSGELRLTGRYKFTSGVQLVNLYGVTISGGAVSDIAESMLVRSAMIFDDAPVNSTGLSISQFLNLQIRDIAIINSRQNEDSAVLELYNGHDFTLDNVKVLSKLGSNSIAIKLGRGTGELSVFNGTIKNCKVYQFNGGISFESNYTNTSLVFQSCYSQNGSYVLNGTVYSSLISCACDGSNTDGYIIRGSDLSNSNTITFVSCGAEGAQFSGFKIESGALNINIVSPHCGANNKAGRNDIGDVLTLEKNNAGLVESIVVSTPTSAAPHGQTPFNIYAGPGVGNVTVISYEPLTLSKGIGGDFAWVSDRLTVVNAETKLNNLLVTNQRKAVQIQAEHQGASLEAGYKKVTQILTASANEFYFYPGSMEKGFIVPNSKIKAISLRLDTDITSSDGGTAMDLIAVDAYPQRRVIKSNVPMQKNTKVDLFNESGLFPITEQNTLGFVLQLRDNKTFDVGGQITAIVYYEYINPLSDRL